MFGIGVVELLVPLAVLLGLAVLIALGRSGHDVPRRERLLVTATRTLGVVGGIAAAVAMSSAHHRLPYGLSTALAPSGFGLVVVVGVVLGETVVRRPRAPGPRTASLRPRTVAAYLPRFTTRAVAIVGVLLVLTLIGTSLTASRAADGHARAFTCVTRNGLTRTYTPYPGVYYSVPLIALLLLTSGIAVLAARAVVLRPRGATMSEHTDDQLRRRSLIVIVAAAGVALGVSLTGVAGVAADAVSASGCHTGPLGSVLGGAAVAGFLVGAWCLVRVFSSDPMDRPWT